MKKTFAFLTALLLVALSQLLDASAAQDNKASSQDPKVDAANAQPADRLAPHKAPADKKTAPKPGDTKPQEPKDDQGITLNTDIVNVTISVTDPYGRFVTDLPKTASTS